MTATYEQKRYLQELKIGKIPDSRPDFNGLGETIALIETTITGSKGNKKAIDTLIQQLATADPRLVELLTEDKPTKVDTQPLDIQVAHDDNMVPPLPMEIVVTPDDTRALCPQKDMYVDYSKRKSPEGYKEFHPSCFWFMISTIDGRRSAANLSGPRYAPLNIVLAARSSAFSKTETANVVDTIMKEARLEYMLTTAKLTPQKFSLTLSGPVPANYGEMTFEQQEYTRLKLARAAQRGWKYDEYGKIITAAQQSGGTMTDLIEFLLKMDDCKESHEYGTIGRGDEIIERPFLPLLGTLTPASIKKIAARGSELWLDGFFARTVFSCPPDHERENKPFERGSISVPPQLCKDLNEFNDRLGVAMIDIQSIENEEGKPTGKYSKQWVETAKETLYHLTDDAYNRWVAYRTVLRDIADSPQWRNDLAASYLRLPTVALRVATLAAALEGKGKTIELRHWFLGQEQAEMWRTSLHELYTQLNNTLIDTGPTLDDMLQSYIMHNGSATARQIMQYGPPPLRRLTSKEMNSLLDAQVKLGTIEKTRRDGSKATWFTYIP